MGKRKPEQWRRNLAVLWLGTFIAGMGFSEIMPFLSLYVDDLGTFTKGQLTLYSGVTYAVTFLVIALISPVWGRLADRKGRKLMLLRSSLGMALVIGLMGFVTNVWQLIGLRFLQGLFAGYIPNASALVAAETPRNKSGNALGILTTGYVSGNLIGPVLGGIMAQVFSIRWTFLLTGIFLIIVFFLSATLVHEHFTPVTRAQQAQGGSWRQAFKNPKLIIIGLDHDYSDGKQFDYAHHQSLRAAVDARGRTSDRGRRDHRRASRIFHVDCGAKAGGVRGPQRHGPDLSLRVRLCHLDVLPARLRDQRMVTGRFPVHDWDFRWRVVPGSPDHADQELSAGADRDCL